MAKNLKYKNRDWLVKQYWKNNLSTTEISRMCGINLKTLFYWMEKFKINRRGKHQHYLESAETTLYKQRWWLVKEYKEKKKSMSKIAKEVKVQPTIIKYWLKKNKIIVENRIGRYKGENNSGWKGGVFDNYGYRYIYCPNHPRVKNATKKYLGEHILMMEKVLSRYLKDGEIVHHKNGNKLDNRPKNLQLMKNEKEHQFLESRLNSFAKKLLFGDINISNKKEIVTLFKNFKSSK